MVSRPETFFVQMGVSYEVVLFFLFPVSSSCCGLRGLFFSFCFLIGYDSIVGVFSLPHITHQIWEGSGELDCLFSHFFLLLLFFLSVSIVLLSSV